MLCCYPSSRLGNVLVCEAPLRPDIPKGCQAPRSRARTSRRDVGILAGGNTAGEVRQNLGASRQGCGKEDYQMDGLMDDIPGRWCPRPCRGARFFLAGFPAVIPPAKISAHPSGMRPKELSCARAEARAWVRGNWPNSRAPRSGARD